MSFPNNSSMSNSSLGTALPVESGIITTEAVLAIVGNFLVVLSTARRQTFPPASRLFVFSMACSDLLLGVSFAMSVDPAEAGRWIYSDTGAKVMATAECSLHTITAIALAGLNLDRRYVLQSGGEGLPLCKSLSFLVVAWVGVFSWYTFAAVYGVPVAYDPIIARPVFDLTTFVWFSVVSYAIFLSAGTATLFCVILVLKVLCSHQVAPNPQVQNVFVISITTGSPRNVNPQQTDDTNARWYAKVVLLLTLGQLLLYLPYSCGMLLRLFSGHTVPPAFLFWSYWLTCFNTCLDVVVYSALQKSFRNALAEMVVSILCGLYNVFCRKNRVDPTGDQAIELTSL